DECVRGAEVDAEVFGKQPEQAAERRRHRSSVACEPGRLPAQAPRGACAGPPDACREVCRCERWEAMAIVPSWRCRRLSLALQVWSVPGPPQHAASISAVAEDGTPAPSVSISRPCR